MKKYLTLKNALALLIFIIIIIGIIFLIFFLVHKRNERLQEADQQGYELCIAKISIDSNKTWNGYCLSQALEQTEDYNSCTKEGVLGADLCNEMYEQRNNYSGCELQKNLADEINNGILMDRSECLHDYPLARQSDAF